MPSVVVQESVRIFAGSVVLDGDLRLPEHPAGLVIFAHGSGSSRCSPRNRAVASALEANGFATLLLDLLTGRKSRKIRVPGSTGSTSNCWDVE